MKKPTQKRNYGPRDFADFCKAAQTMLREPNNPEAAKALQLALQNAGVTAPEAKKLTAEERAQLDAQIRRERGAIYGDAFDNHENQGLLLTGLIQQHYKIRLAHPVPPDLAMMMMVACKINRSVTGSYHEDNYRDARVYVQMADEACERRSKGGAK